MRKAPNEKNKQLVLIGAGHGNLHLLKNASILQQRKYEITLISPTDFNYNGVAPGILETRYPDDFGKIPCQCHLDKVGGRYYQNEVTRINVMERMLFLNDKKSIQFDYLSINIGGRVPINEINGTSRYTFPIRPVEHLWQFNNELRTLLRKKPKTIAITVIGGGAAGVEVAGNVHQLIKSRGIIPVISMVTRGKILLPQFHIKASLKVLNSFQKRGIEVKLECEVKELKEKQAILSSKIKLPFDLCIMATGIRPNKIETQETLQTTNTGEIIVNAFLQSKDYPYIFASGDCSYFEPQPLWKSGFHAINQGPILLKNLIAISKGLKLHKYQPTKRILTALYLGDGTGLLIIGKFSYLGKLSFIIKDYIERRYIKSNQC
ncbi:MAG: NAD(P)/FAD-dependent oxidoreductase [Candidatus Hodarchaeales archaeon]|jgi:NADH dehydrogenase FAD-containing subunit